MRSKKSIRNMTPEAKRLAKWAREMRGLALKMANLAERLQSIEMERNAYVKAASMKAAAALAEEAAKDAEALECSMCDVPKGGGVCLERNCRYFNVETDGQG